MATLSFDKASKVMTVDAPDVEIFIQEIVDQVRPYEALLENQDIPKIMDAFGKIEVGVGEFTAITYVLLDGWTIAFEARSGPGTTRCFVSGGNLVADGGGDPITATAFTNTTIKQSTAPAAIGLDTLETLVGSLDTAVAELVKAHFNKLITDPDTGKITLYDDDDTTILREGDLFEDDDATQPYRGQGADRRNRMT